MAPFLFIGTTEVFFVLLVVVLLFGTDKLPEMARGLGEGLRHIRQVTEDIKSEVLSQVDKNADLKAVRDGFKRVDRDLKTAVEEDSLGTAKSLADQSDETAGGVGSPGSEKRTS